jgi:hypothetical protein
MNSRVERRGRPSVGLMYLYHMLESRGGTCVESCEERIEEHIHTTPLEVSEVAVLLMERGKRENHQLNPTPAHPTFHDKSQSSLPALGYHTRGFSENKKCSAAFQPTLKRPPSSTTFNLTRSLHQPTIT